MMNVKPGDLFEGMDPLVPETYRLYDRSDWRARVTDIERCEYDLYLYETFGKDAVKKQREANAKERNTWLIRSVTAKQNAAIRAAEGDARRNPPQGEFHLKIYPATGDMRCETGGIIYREEANRIRQQRRAVAKRLGL